VWFFVEETEHVTKYSARYDRKANAIVFEREMLSPDRQIPLSYVQEIEMDALVKSAICRLLHIFLLRTKLFDRRMPLMTALEAGSGT